MSDKLTRLEQQRTALLLTRSGLKDQLESTERNIERLSFAIEVLKTEDPEPTED